jgi:hypothetical protein
MHSALTSIILLLYPRHRLVGLSKKTLCSIGKIMREIDYAEMRLVPELTYPNHCADITSTDHPGTHQ